MASEQTAFFDTNVLLYLLSKDYSKADKVEELLAAGGVVSVQVLSEFVSVASRKLAMKWSEIRDCLEPFRVVLRIEPLTIVTDDQAVEIAERYKLSFYDALIVAAAKLSDCTRLYSEDLQHGQVFEKSLTVLNPFKA
jgi:predicted nucleic acid-binding protein